MSFMYSMNNNGPITLPYTKPLERLVMLDKELIVTDFNLLWPVSKPSNSGRVQSCPFAFLEYLSCPSKFSIALRHISRAIKAWWNDVEIFEIVQPNIELRHRKWRLCGWFFGENVINLIGDHWIKGRNSPFSPLEANSTLLRFGDAEVTAANSNIAPFTIRCEFNGKSKWRTWNRKNLHLTLQMEYMWNCNGIRIRFASNNIVGEC